MTAEDRPVREVLLAFAKLGLSSFGGPVAHLGYFRDEFVVRRRWIGDAAYSDLVGLCQFLPGPASSQVAFALGLFRGGYAGAVAAWVGFTAPSAALLIAFAYGAGSLGGAGSAGAGVLHGLKLVAVPIVAQAVVGMARSLCPDVPRASIAIGALLILAATASTGAQLAVIALGGLVGFFACRTGSVVTHEVRNAVSARAGLCSLALFGLLLVLSLALQGAVSSPAWNLFAAFYRSGALVFGGGHVVLPLLREAVVTPGWVSEDAFLAGYGAAQAVPGPLFTVAAYLGAVARPLPGVAGALIGLVGIFLPGTLILVGALPFWTTLGHNLKAQSVVRGVNAAVVGLLAAALYDPIWKSTVHSGTDLGLAALGFVLLMGVRAPPWVVVLVCAIGAVVAGSLSPAGG